MFCCDNIPAKYAPVESGLHPGMRRQNQQDAPGCPGNRTLVKTAGNALREAPPASSLTCQVSCEIRKSFAIAMCSTRLDSSQ